nr:bifunctional hydroxymethylpyrimidine kinase/phosphomethylpyrimidine kinase [Corynebacterium sp. c6VSa_13]
MGLPQAHARSPFAERPTVNRPPHYLPTVLSIAGTDPTGGAGIQADIKAICEAGGFPFSVVTALVAQNTQGVRSIHTPPVDFLRAQLDAVWDDVRIDAVKIGMLGTAEITRTVDEYLQQHRPPVLVVDPVMVATSGDSLLDAAAQDALRELCSRADVITPNLPELAVLAQVPDPAVYRGPQGWEHALGDAKDLAHSLDTVIIVKGGHLTGASARNAVVAPDGAVSIVESPRIATRHTHGTGCSLSSALATRLASGEAAPAALQWATTWINEAIAHADELHIGHGNGPIDHTHRSRRLLRAADTTPWPEPAAVGTEWQHPDDLAATAQATLADDSTATPTAVAAAGPWTNALWQAARPITDATWQLDFIQGLASGRVPRQQFDFYLSQDAVYLEGYARALAGLAVRASAPEDVEWWAQAALGCIEERRQLHDAWLETSPASGKTTEPSPVTLAYVSFLQSRVLSDDAVVGAAAVLPCFWLYAEVGHRMAQLTRQHSRPAAAASTSKKASDGVLENPYSPWIAAYEDADFHAEVGRAIAYVEGALAAASPEVRARAAKEFLRAWRFELGFFDQASRQE